MEERVINKYGLSKPLRDLQDYIQFCIKYKCSNKLPYEMWQYKVEHSDHFTFNKPFFEEAHKLHIRKYWIMDFNTAFLTICGELSLPIIIEK